MKGIRDLSSIIDSLETLKAVLFVYCHSTFLCTEVAKTIKHISEIPTLEDLRQQVRVEVLNAINVLSESCLDYYRAMGEVGAQDPAFDFLRSKLDVVEAELKKIRILL